MLWEGRACVWWRRRLEWKRFTLRNHDSDDVDADHEKLAQSIAERRVNTEEHLNMDEQWARAWWGAIDRSKASEFRCCFIVWDVKESLFCLCLCSLENETGDLIVGHNLAWIGSKNFIVDRRFDALSKRHANLERWIWDPSKKFQDAISLRVASFVRVDASGCLSSCAWRIKKDISTYSADDSSKY